MADIIKSDDRITIRMGAVKERLQLIAHRQQKNLAQVVREVLTKFVDEEVPVQKSEKDINFLTKFRGVDDSSEEEFTEMMEYMQQNRKLKSRNYHY